MLSTDDNCVSTFVITSMDLGNNPATVPCVAFRMRPCVAFATVPYVAHDRAVCCITSLYQQWGLVVLSVHTVVPGRTMAYGPYVPRGKAAVPDRPASVTAPGPGVSQPRGVSSALGDLHTSGPAATTRQPRWWFRLCASARCCRAMRRQRMSWWQRVARWQTLGRLESVALMGWDGGGRCGWRMLPQSACSA